MKLILFGGVQGVGKTTLLSCISHAFGERVILLDPGELFRRYAYDTKLMTPDAVEELIAETLQALPTDAVAVAHWHYAVRRPDGYIPQISFPRLERLAKNGKIDHVTLFSVEASAEVIRKRRVADHGSKKRACSLPGIYQEIATDQKFLARHHTLFSKALGKNKVAIVRLPNTDLSEARSLLNVFFTSLLSGS